MPESCLRRSVTENFDIPIRLINVGRNAEGQYNSSLNDDCPKCATIDTCTDGIGEYDDGLICRVTAALPQKLGIDQTAVYGDYFYLEALLRYIKPDFKMYW